MDAPRAVRVIRPPVAPAAAAPARERRMRARPRPKPRAGSPRRGNNQVGNDSDEEADVDAADAPANDDFEGHASDEEFFRIPEDKPQKKLTGHAKKHTEPKRCQNLDSDSNDDSDDSAGDESDGDESDGEESADEEYADESSDKPDSDKSDDDKMTPEKVVMMCSRPVRMLLWRAEESTEMKFREITGTILINAHREPIQICGIDESKTQWHVTKFSGDYDALSANVLAARPMTERYRFYDLRSYGLDDYLKAAKAGGVCVIFAVNSLIGIGRCTLYKPADLPRTHRVYTILKKHIVGVDFGLIESAKTAKIAKQRRGCKQDDQYIETLQMRLIGQIYENLDHHEKERVCRVHNMSPYAYGWREQLKIIEKMPDAKKKYVLAMRGIRDATVPQVSADFDFD